MYAADTEWWIASNTLAVEVDCNNVLLLSRGREYDSYARTSVSSIAILISIAANSDSNLRTSAVLAHESIDIWILRLLLVFHNHPRLHTDEPTIATHPSAATRFFKRQVILRDLSVRI